MLPSLGFNEIVILGILALVVVGPKDLPLLFRKLGRWTAKASAPRGPKKARPPVECAIPLRDYRGAGGSYVAQVALAQGWELRPTDVRKEVRLWWTAASHID